MARKKGSKRSFNFLKWFFKPSASLPESEKRRSNLLSYLHLFLLVVLIAAFFLVLATNPPSSPRRTVYLTLIYVLTVIIGLAYWLNRSGYYLSSAIATVLCAFAGPWGSILLDPLILKGDFVPLTFVTISVLLSSILLTPLVTILLAVCQLILLAFVPNFTAGLETLNWPSFLAFIFITSLLNIVANIISRSDMKQIDQQQKLLKISEAELREESVRDVLTGLYNRRYLEETLTRELKRAARNEYSLGIIMIDIDHFKGINDSLGHAAGDAFLKEFGKLLKEQIRQYDIASRYGGEEFVLMMPEVTKELTRERAESLREKTKQLRVLYNEKILEPISISLGVAIYPEHGSTCEAILKSADDALYKAKSEGRDRVVVAD